MKKLNIIMHFFRFLVFHFFIYFIYINLFVFFFLYLEIKLNIISLNHKLVRCPSLERD